MSINREMDKLWLTYLNFYLTCGGTEHSKNTSTVSEAVEWDERVSV